mmetsp:Transcript_8077/g.13201  ORF Transcript_8077/g.13201 Transcript_8077/m.13201 type:complete len:117 (+) Transcript_8077:1051-1401(+)
MTASLGICEHLQPYGALVVAIGALVSYGLGMPIMLAHDGAPVALAYELSMPNMSPDGAPVALAYELSMPNMSPDGAPLAYALSMSPNGAPVGVPDMSPNGAPVAPGVMFMVIGVVS